MKSISYFLTVLLFILVGISFFVHSTAIYTAMGAVFCIDVAINFFARANSNNNSDNDSNNN